MLRYSPRCCFWLVHGLTARVRADFFDFLLVYRLDFLPKQYYTIIKKRNFYQYIDVISLQYYMCGDNMSIVSEEQVIKVMRQYNPWWKNQSVIREDSKPYKRLAFYKAVEILDCRSIRRFLLLSGARRVGKTTIMYQLIEKLLSDGVNPRNILYISFDNPIIKLESTENILHIFETLYPTDGMKYVFFDEIQYAENWELWLKVIYDSRKDISLTATGSASPILEKGSAESGTGRWTVLKIPTLSFYEYCQLLQLKTPELPDGIRITDLAGMTSSQIGDIVEQFSHLTGHFNRYLMIGGFPELVLSDDDNFAQRMLREDVVDKVIKRDVLTLFNIRNPLLMEKLFLYLCINSSEIFNAATAAKELENITVNTIDNYIDALEMSNLIYVSKPVGVGSKSALKGKPKIYIADAAIRNAVLMVEDVLSDEAELGIMAETTVYKHLVSFYQNSPAVLGYYRKLKDNQKEVDVVIELPREKILCEVKYKNNSHIPVNDAIVELCNDESTRIKSAFLITKRQEDFGISRHTTKVPIMRIPAIVFLYMLGKLEAEGMNGKL